MTEAQREAFKRLTLAQEPENLWWDGERSEAEVRKALRQIRSEWAALEREVGRRVDEAEVWGWLMEAYR